MAEVELKELLSYFGDFHGGRVGVASLLLRVIVGVAFLFHGYAKVADIQAFAAEFRVPVLLAAAGAYTQLVGGLLLIVGLLTPVAAAGIGSTMAVATLKLIGRGERFVDPAGHSWEAAAFYVVTCASIILLGPGAHSLDGLLFR